MKKLLFMFTFGMIFGQDCLSPDYTYDECMADPDHSCLSDCDCNAGRCCSPFGWCQDANSEWCLATSCGTGELECWDGSCVNNFEDCLETENCSDPDTCPLAGTGDVNGDGDLNVVDIIQIINIIIGESFADECETETADVNGDGNLDILDIVQIVNAIIGEFISTQKLMLVK